MKDLTPPIRKDRKPLWELLPLKQPLRVNIDPCDACNFKCDFCFQSKSREFHGNIMTVEMFEKTIAQLKEFDEPINVVHLFGLGEPLLNQNIPYFVRRIKEEAVAKEVKITTNGSLLTHSLTDELMGAGLDELTISLNGLADEDFEKIVNVRISFDEMFDNIKYLYAHRGNCHIHIKIIGDYFSEEKRALFVNKIGPYADTINIDGVTNHWSGLKAAAKVQQQYDVGGGSFKEWPICALCFYELTVHSNGSVSPCVADWQKDKQNLGNISELSLKEIWESEKRKKMLISFLKGTENPYIACRTCEYPGAGAGVNLEPYKEELLRKYV
ncbi:MAG: radical SAM protein [Butyrivibrio sp.]|nr:radical SAM protein [Butyrivibrio sp.]